MLTLALPKGRLAEDSITLFLEKGWLAERPDPESRKLMFTDPLGKLNLLLVRSKDVATYVEECAADAGITGLDDLSEGDFDLLMPVDLKLGACRLSLAAKPEFELTQKVGKVKVATKYTKLARKFFFTKGISCEIIKLYGSIELAPLCGLSDCIVDLVSTGSTLKANGLVEKEIILESSARLIANRSSLYTKRKEMKELILSLSN